MPVELDPGHITRSAALTVFAALADRWGIAKTKRYQLLGGPAERTVNGWYGELEAGRGDDHAQLEPMILERISHLLSIFNGIHRLINEPFANDWIHAPNRAFGDRKPIDLLISGRMDELLEVRRYVDRAVHQ